MSASEMLARLFSGVDPAPAQPAAPTGQPVTPAATSIPPAGGVPAPQGPGTAPNGTIPAPVNNPTVAAPLDEFKDLWNTDPNSKSPDDPRIFGQVNGDALLNTAKQMDFAKDITPEDLAAISAGGETASQALLKIVNAVQQRGYAQSTYAATQLIEQAIEKASARFQTQIPQMLRNQNTQNLIKEDPVMSHPAAQPLINSLVNQFQVKFPEASPAQLQEYARSYLQNFAASINGNSPAARQAQQATSEENWVEFFSK